MPCKIISLKPLLEDSPARTEAAQNLISAFRKEGFLYLTGFSAVIPPKLIKAVFAGSAHFFARPVEEKNNLPWTNPRGNRGYTSQGQEKTSQAQTKEETAKVLERSGEDLKESFEIGRDDEEEHPNLWPQDGSEENVAFVKNNMEFFKCCKEVHRLLMKGIAIGLGLDDKFFESFVRVGDNTLRLLHYGAVPPGGFEGGRRVRAGAHTDFGSLTLLFQDHQGGLQVEHPGGWLEYVFSDVIGLGSEEMFNGHKIPSQLS